MNEKILSLVEKAKLRAELKTGKTAVIFKGIEDRKLGIEINHVFTPHQLSKRGYGNGVSLNLTESIMGSSGNGVKFEYTDWLSRKHYIKERIYCVDSNGEAYDVSQNQLKVNPNGDLIYMTTSKDTTAYRELYSEDGLKMEAPYKGIEGVDSIEQRNEEIKKVEEQIFLYEKALENIVQVSLQDNSVKYMTKAEALTYESLLSQKPYIESQEDLLKRQIEEMQKTGKKNNADVKNVQDTVAFSQIAGNEELMEKYISYVAVYEDGEIEYEISSVSDFNESNFNTLASKDNYHFTRLELAEYRSLLSQYDITLADEDETAIKRQIANIQEQINMLLEKSEENEHNYNSYRKELGALKERLAALKHQMPIYYLIDNNVIKGFNEYGTLCTIYERDSDNHITIEVTKHYSRNENKITGISNSNGDRITLHYDDDLGLLREMINSSGEVVSYEYDDDENLIKVNYGDNQSLTFERGTDYLKVANGDKYAQMTYSNINLTAVEYFTSVNEISNGRTVYFNTPQRIERISFVCGLNASVTTEGQQTVEEYKFDTDGRLTEYCEKEKGKYVKAEKYEYVGMGKYNVSTVQDNGLHSDTVAFEDMCQSTVVFDSFNRVKTESVFNKIIHISNGVKTKRDLETTYKYNEKGQPARAVTNEKIYIDIQAPIKEYNHVVLLEYNERGQLLKKQSYTEGEEKTNGINIEEYDYDKNGYETRSVKYNSLDPSTRLYEQAEVNEKGQITAIYDISGRNRTVYEYLDGTSTACSERYPNGSKLSYGISPIDQSAAITMSTENGEGNSITRLYTNGLATRVIDAENEYDYKYDKKGRVTSITKNNHNYMNFSYIDLDNLKSVTENHRLGLIKKTEKTANYDKLVLTHNSNSGFTAEVRINKHPDGLAMNKIVTKNNVNAYIVEYSYDESKKPSEAVFYRCNDSGVPEPTRVENYTYDSLGNVVSKTVTDGEDETVYSYTFSSDSQSRLESISFDGIEILPKYDCLGRKTEKEVKLNNNSIAKERIDYVKHADHATLMPKSIVYKNGDSVRYNYDRMGYISQIYDNNAIACEYKYDKLGRIIRENNKLFNRTTIYKYDNAGNIIAKGYTSFNLSPSREIEVISTQATYQYSEGGSLSKYGGKLYTTNQITGYPTVWRSEALTWDLCNKLSAFGENTFEYDVEGKRTKKNDISFYYDVSDKLVKQSNGIEYIYDNESIIGFKHTVTTNNISTTNTYFYRKDILGNVIAILDANGNVVVKYVYDAWGNHIVKNASGTVITNEAFIGNINPIRYRSYYYDTETKLYYLNARYYDPDVCRFISPDDLSYLDPETIGGTNLYAYCGNNPVMYADPSGNFGIFSFLIGLGATAFFSWLGGQIFGQQVVSGISSIGSGISTTLTGVSLLAFGPVGWVLGGVVGLIGLGTTLLGVNETVAGITGINYLQQWTGMSDDWYNGLYTGFNIASLVANLVGNAYMKYADVLGKTHIGRTGKPLSRYSLVDENGIKQYRFYDYRGNAWYDKDFRHTGSERKFPHYHGWRDGIRNSKHWSFWELIKWLL